jgi:hypothetical protein
MAGRKFLTNIDLQSNELQNAVIHKLNSDPTGVNGKIYYNTVSDKFRVYQDGAWKDLATGGSAASTVTLTGDVTGTANVDPATGIISVETTLNADFATEAEAQGYANTAESNANSYTDTEINALTTDAIEEGSVNLYFTNQRALDATASAYDPAGSAATAESNANAYTDTAIGGVVASVTGTTGEIEVSGTANDPIIGLPDDVTISGILTVNGDLNVEGNLNAVNRTEINIEDNTIVLNTGVTGTPSIDAGIQVERGDETNASILWNETSNKWELGLLGSETAISIEGHTHVASDVTDFDSQVKTVVNDHVVGSSSILVEESSVLSLTSYVGFDGTNWSFGNIAPGAYEVGQVLTVSGASGSIDVPEINGESFEITSVVTVGSSTSYYSTDLDTFLTGVPGYFASSYGSFTVSATVLPAKLKVDTILSGGGFLTKTNGLAVDLNAIVTQLKDSYLFTKKYATNIGDETSTSFEVTHNLNSRDVQVQVYNNVVGSSDFGSTVEVDVVRTSTNAVTVSFTVAPGLLEYRVVVVG